MADLVLINAEIVARTASVPRGWVAVDGGRIAAIGGAGTQPPAADQTLDLEGLTLLPGVVDPHTHPGNYGMFEDELAVLTRGAARGGVTSILGIVKSTRLAGAYKPLVRADDIGPYGELFEAARSAIARTSYVDVGLTPIVMDDLHVAEIDHLAGLGMTSFKFFPSMAAPTEWHASVGIASRIDDGVVFAGLRRIARVAGIACFHAENLQAARVLLDEAMASGDDLEAWERASPSALEASDIRKMAFFAAETGAAIYSVHTNSARGVAEIRAAKEAGIRIRGETCPHYLLLTTTSPGSEPVLAKAGPPLRDETDREALWEALRDGVLDTVGSDDPVMSLERKKATAGVWGANPGFGGSGLLLPLLLSEGVHRGRITLRRLVEVCSENPARIFGLYPRKGAIDVGSDADLVAVDLGAQAPVRATDLGYEFSPYEGMMLTGWPVRSFLRGSEVLAKRAVARPRAMYLARAASEAA